MEEEYRSRVELAKNAIRDLHLERTKLREEELHAARRHLLLWEKSALIHSLHEGFIGNEAYEKLMRDVDARMVLLEAGETPHAVPKPLLEESTPPAPAGEGAEATSPGAPPASDLAGGSSTKPSSTTPPGDDEAP